MNMQTATSLSRRALLASFLSLPVIAQAHSGHKHTPITAQAKVVKVKDGVVTLKLDLINTRSTEVRLFRVSADGAAPVGFQTPFEVGGFGAATLKVDLVFSGAVPAGFITTLDFGEHGHEQVTVTP